MQWMSSWMSYMVCLVAVSCQISFQNTSVMGGPGHHVHWTRSLQLFPLRLPQRSCVPHHPTHCSGVASWNWRCYWRDHKWHVAWYSWQLCGLLTSNPLGWRISYQAFVHMKTTCTQTPHESELSFTYNMPWYLRKTWIYCTSKLLHVSLSTLYLVEQFPP